jgi:hypothetical protein
MEIVIRLHGISLNRKFDGIQSSGFPLISVGHKSVPAGDSATVRLSLPAGLPRNPEAASPELIEEEFNSCASPSGYVRRDTVLMLRLFDPLSSENSLNPAFIL